LTFFRKYMLMVGWIVFSCVATSSWAVTLTAEQMKMAASLSSADKAKLAKQAGVALPEAAPKEVLSQPTVIAPMKLGTSAIEKSVRERLSSLGGATEGSTTTEGMIKVDKELRDSWRSMLTSKRNRRINSGLSQYGYKLFSGAPSTFAPVTEVPVPAEYVLGPGDEISVHLYGSENEEMTLIVDRKGEINFPLIGPLAIARMRFSEAKAFIVDQVQEKKVGVRVNVSMGKLRSIRVFLLGDVNNPGSYVVSGLSTISNALFVSGGVSKQGSLRHIILKRAGKKITELDLYDFLLKGDSSRDLRLLPGDVVFVPPIGGVVAVAGEVTRPGIYELKNTKARNDITDILKLAGGSLASADLKHVQIDRLTAGGDRTLVDLNILEAGRSTGVKDGDIVLVYSVPGLESDTVQLTGHIKRPGTFGFKKGMKLSDLIRSYDDLMPYAFLDYMIIQRTNPMTGELTILRPPLGKLLEKQFSDTDIALYPDDKLMVFSNVVMSQLDSVVVSGAVRHPGKFPLGKRLRISDLVLAAGGPMENAYMQKAELTRYTVVDGEKRSLHHTQVDLAKAMSGDKAADLLLQPHDVLMVRQITNWRAHEQVELKGEFRFPGIYTIQDGETIDQVIERAGGVTEEAFMAGAFFSREAIREVQQKRLQTYADNLEKEIAQTEVAIQSINDPKLLANKQKGLSAAQGLLAKYRNLKPEGRLLIDLDANGKLAGGATLKLADADVLYIPKRPDQVMVIGEVYNQSAMLYRNNRDRDDFIALSGGVTSMADEDRIYIIRANGYIDSGSGWNRDKHIYPGDTIVVPQKLEAFNLLDSTLDWSKVLMQIGIFTASMVTVGIL